MAVPDSVVQRLCSSAYGALLICLWLWFTTECRMAVPRDRSEQTPEWNWVDRNSDFWSFKSQHLKNGRRCGQGYY